jgi:hypothetical protein
MPRPLKAETGGHQSIPASNSQVSPRRTCSGAVQGQLADEFRFPPRKRTSHVRCGRLFLQRADRSANGINRVLALWHFFDAAERAPSTVSQCHSTRGLRQSILALITNSAFTVCAVGHIFPP